MHNKEILKDTYPIGVSPRPLALLLAPPAPHSKNERDHRDHRDHIIAIIVSPIFRLPLSSGRQLRGEQKGTCCYAVLSHRHRNNTDVLFACKARILVASHRFVFARGPSKSALSCFDVRCQHASALLLLPALQSSSTRLRVAVRTR